MNTSSILLTFVGIFVGCGSSAAQLAPLVDPPGTFPLGSSSAAPIASQATPVAQASAAVPIASADYPSTDSPSTAPPASSLPRVAFDQPYKLGLRLRPKEKEAAKEDAQLLLRWNEGGRDGTWHPVPRVKVDNPRVVGKISPAIVLRETRKLHYWPIRRCYDPALLKDQALRGSVTVKFTIKATGHATAGAIVGQPTLKDPMAARCVAASFATLHFPRPTKGSAKVTIDVALNPGDAPMRSTEEPAGEPGPGSIDVHALQALVANNSGVAIMQCFAQGQARVAGLWGRMALRVDLGPDGSVRDVVESESTFPDSATTQCVLDVLKKATFPAPTNGDLRVVIPIRFGNLAASRPQ